MSWSLRAAASGFMMGLSRAPDLNSRSCSAMYTALCPASRGHSGLVLLPCGPWHEEHSAALPSPLAALPVVNGEVAALALAGAAAVAAGGAAGAAPPPVAGGVWATAPACAMTKAAAVTAIQLRLSRIVLFPGATSAIRGRRIVHYGHAGARS